MPLEAGDLILDGRYRIEARIGRGTSGVVYRATHVGLGATRAVRVLARDAPGMSDADDGHHRHRLHLEFQIATQIDRPHVLDVYDLVEDEGVLYEVLAYAPNGSLADQLAVRGALPWMDGVRLLLDTARGLDALHERGMVHRDVTPSHILTDAQGRARIGGLGRVQVGGGDLHRSPKPDGAVSAHPGTPAYRSPEHDTQAPLTPTSDVYSLGCVAFEMLTGEAWRSARQDVTCVRDLQPDVPVWLDAVVMRMLREIPGVSGADAEDPTKRYGDMQGVIAAVKEGLARKLRQQYEAPAQLSGHRQPARATGRWAGVVLGMVVVLGLMAWGVRGLFRVPNPSSQHVTGEGVGTRVVTTALPAPTAASGPSSASLVSARTLRVGIIAGHMGSDSGAVCPDGLREVDINRRIATQVVERLQGMGWHAELLEEFDVKLNGYKADALLSIHADSCHASGRSGFKIARAESSYIPGSEDWLVDCISQHYHEATGLAFDRHTITYDMTRYHAYYEIDPNTPAAILEAGFMLDDRELLMAPSEQVVNGIVNGLICFLKREGMLASHYAR
jgi:N-acetylmuramoyl-L-alanine amidase